ncbi:putative reverse transcriptase domain-containing protein [Tanacetum coccineum]|uniref:Reverse transcriptase domain-containing protein n=1 Tax=Tanacetum coccineum TaxID=301880 RepID=A0ABQ5A5G4_9ASTR
MATPFANPERQFRARRDTLPAPIHKIYTFYESDSSESEYEDLRKTTFSGSSTKNAIEHFGKVLKVASLFNINDSALLRVFPLTLVGVAKRWFDRTSPEHAKNWDGLKQNFIRRFCSPAMILEQLGEIRLGNPKPINMVIEMADRSMQSRKGIIENVLVKINKFIFPVNFIILDIIEDDKVPIILGRPMLATAHARIDVFVNEIDEPRNLEELLLSDDIDRDLGSFLEDNDLLPDLESQDIMSLSPPGSAKLSDDSSRMFCNPNSNSSISIDDFV